VRPDLHLVLCHRHRDRELATPRPILYPHPVQCIRAPYLSTPCPPCILTPDIHDISSFPSPAPPSDVEVEAEAEEEAKPTSKAKSKPKPKAAPKRKAPTRTVS
jgi:hypothetical protein